MPSNKSATELLFYVYRTLVNENPNGNKSIDIFPFITQLTQDHVVPYNVCVIKSISLYPFALIKIISNGWISTFIFFLSNLLRDPIPIYGIIKSFVSIYVHLHI